ncbi:hypothetical protein [Paenibacillus sp. FSL M7-0420]|uniref:hypothetical protein n=1 Tax=Paenibacillus sp. FSL M7-0420 TaxID=2921609 RepID=UPI0030F8A731
MEITSAEDIMIQLSGMDRENSVSRIYVPGIGEFIIVLLKTDESAAEDSARTSGAEAKECTMPAAGLTRNPYL